MSKVTYIFGAGASFGERTPSPSNPNLKDISRGLPIVSELQAAIKSQIYLLEGRHAIEDFNELGINDCPPNPGLTDINSTISTSVIISSRELTGVEGLSVTAAFIPAFLIACMVRCR